MKTLVIQTHNHRHEGRLLNPGERIAVDETTADWLIERGVAALADGDKPKVTPIHKTGDKP